ncbi:duf4419 domain protein [Fusarium sporotrichioides]|uniref:Duf4419 domain protein n=1 Tax=Fusarium sporotrichioides TaxID=5514 RepID=A0A395SP76_FUSSP|nr:duf4419 domain protein [Fusarium sporotrichioides]
MSTASDTWVFPCAGSRRDILQCASPYFSRRSASVKSSIYTSEPGKMVMAGSENGFVWSACRAYNESKPLIIRPDDIWLAIIENIGRYCIQRTVETPLEERLDVPTLSHKDFSSPRALAEEMQYLVNRKCFSQELMSSLIPDFSTTLPEDITAACILLLGSERKDKAPCDLRFREGGIPRMIFYRIRPILRLLHYAAREPASSTAGEFLSTMVKKTPLNGKDDDLVTGWITSFCYFDAEGQIRQPNEEGDGPSDQDVQPKVLENKDTTEENEEDGLF